MLLKTHTVGSSPSRRLEALFDAAGIETGESNADNRRERIGWGSLPLRDSTDRSSRADRLQQLTRVRATPGEGAR